MICPKCGSDSEKNIKFCTSCGAPLSSSINETIESHNKLENQNNKDNLMGYSKRINDPAFVGYHRKSIAWSFIFSFILAIITVVGFYIYGERSMDMDNPAALYIGLAIGGMFITIAILQTFFRSVDSTYDMVLVDKQIEKKTRRVKSEDESHIERYNLYTLIFKTDKGKIKTISKENEDLVYNFYKIGDKVRHHKGSNALEKYDKSQDAQIFCISCGTLNDINDDKCYRCFSPLLK